MGKVLILGSGNVGAGLAFHIGSKPEIGSHVFDIKSRNIASAQSAILDVASAYPTSRENIKAVNKLASDYDLVVVTVGLQPESGKPTTQHLARNIAISESALVGLPRHIPHILVASPIDRLTRIVQKRIGLTSIIGFGGDLDQKRLEYVLDLKGINQESIPHIIGEHGSRCIPVYDNDEATFEEVRDEVGAFLKRNQVDSGKSRNLASGLLLANLVETFVSGQEKIHWITALHPVYEEYITWPWLISEGRVREPIDIQLTTKSEAAFRQLLEFRKEEYVLDSKLSQSVELGDQTKPHR